MSIVFKLVGNVNSKMLEIKINFVGQIKLSLILDMFETYGLSKEDFEHLRIVAKSETLKSDDKIFNIEINDNFVLYIFSPNKIVKEKLNNIFIKNCTDLNNQVELNKDDDNLNKKEDDNLNKVEDDDNLNKDDDDNLNKEDNVDLVLKKNIDIEEKTLIPVLTDEIISEINIKSSKLFESEDFKHLIRIYYTNEDVMKTFFNFVNNGDIVKMEIPNNTQKNYDTEIEILKSLGITETNEKIEEVLKKFNGHLNLSLRTLLVRKSIEMVN